MGRADRCWSWWSLLAGVLAAVNLLAVAGLVASLLEPALVHNPVVDGLGVLLAVAYAVPSSWVLVRAPFHGTRLRDDHLVYRGFFRSRRVPIDQIDALEATITDYKFLPVWSPVITVTDSSTVKCGTLSGYGRSAAQSNRRVARQVETMRGWLSANGHSPAARPSEAEAVTTPGS